MSSEIEFIPDRLNQEPVIFIGMTDSELRWGGLLSVLFWVPVCVVLAALLGQAILGIALGVLLALGCMWVTGRKLRTLKRGKPQGFHVLAIVALLEDAGIKSKTMIRESRSWDVRRARV